MSKEIINAPYDEIGMPLPIIIVNTPPGKSTEQNRHHAFYDEAVFINGTDATRAVRFSRLQKVPIWLHNRYHVKYRKGVPTPKNEYEAFKLTILGYAGYLPSKGVDLSKGEPIERHLSRRQRRELRKPDVFTVEDRTRQSNIIGNFLINYAIKNGLEEVEEFKIGKFLGTKSQHKKYQLGLDIIEAAAVAAAEPFELIYSSSRKRHLLKHGAPGSPEKIVLQHIMEKVPLFTDLMTDTIVSIVD